MCDTTVTPLLSAKLCSQALSGIDEGCIRVATIPTGCRQAADLEDRWPSKSGGDQSLNVCRRVDVTEPQGQVMIDFGAWCVGDVQGAQLWRHIPEVPVMIDWRVIDVPNET